VWAQRGITLVVDGESRHVRTQASTVSELLDEESLQVDANDVVNPSLDSELRSGNTVVVRRSIPVVLESGGERIDLEVVGDTVADALVAAGLDPAGSPGVRPAIHSPLKSNMTVTVPDVLVRVESEQESVPPTVRRTNDSSLKKGKERVIDRGRPGRLLRVYRVVVSAGVETTPVLTTEQVIRKPEPRIIAVGTGVATSGPGALPAGRKRSLRVVATGYSAKQPGLDDTTATGARAKHGVVAVDPRVIPLGTRVYVPGYGTAVAADTGGDIKGGRIDLCFDTVEEAVVWGRRSVTVYVLR